MPHALLLREVEFSAIRSQGRAGRTSTRCLAPHLRFDIRRSSLPQAVKDKLLRWDDQRITKDGVVVIKAPNVSQPRPEQGRSAGAAGRAHCRRHVRAPSRRATKPTYASKQRRLEGKSQRSNIKSGRGKVAF